MHRKKTIRAACALILATMFAASPGTAALASGGSDANSQAGSPRPTGWILDARGRYFYMDSHGEPVYGWVDDGGKRYYINDTQGMITGEFFVDGLPYFFGDDGALTENPAGGRWHKANGQWYYTFSDGAVARGWQVIGGTYYYLRPEDGMMLTGWQLIDGQWCFLGSSGAYVPSAIPTGWVYSSGWHFFNAYGQELSGWILDKGKWYYIDTVQGLLTDNHWYLSQESRWYRFDAAGVSVAMPKGWIHVGRGWIYRNADGTHVTGWKTIGGKEYYFRSGTGIMATGAMTIDGREYKFGDDGALLSASRTGWITYGDTKRYYTSASVYATGWKTIGGKTYYFDPGTGAMARGTANIGGKYYILHPTQGHTLRGWQKDEYGHWYYLASDGSFTPGWIYDSGVYYYIDFFSGMLTGICEVSGRQYFFDASGRMVVGWCRQGSTWYYAESSGALAVGWKVIGGSWYYFLSDGSMATQWERIDGKWYYFHPTAGHMLSGTTVGSYRLGTDGAWIP